MDSRTTTNVSCELCFRHCRLRPGERGACRVRENRKGTIVSAAYGKLTSLALDPIEKKPISFWRSGTTLLSLGSFGCNLYCPWCQNASISQAGEDKVDWIELSPESLSHKAASLAAVDRRMIGVAYTYNEPLMNWEYVRDCAELVRAAGLVNVLVSAGCVSRSVVERIAPLIDAANIDLKSFSEETYRRLGGERQMVFDAIETFASEPNCHLELTCLIVPGINDSDDEMRSIASWIAGLDPSIPLHVTRFFPAWRMRDAEATPRERVYELADLAREFLEHVLVGNC